MALRLVDRSDLCLRLVVASRYADTSFSTKKRKEKEQIHIINVYTRVKINDNFLMGCLYKLLLSLLPVPYSSLLTKHSTCYEKASRLVLLNNRTHGILLTNACLCKML